MLLMSVVRMWKTKVQCLGVAGSLQHHFSSRTMDTARIVCDDAERDSDACTATPGVRFCIYCTIHARMYNTLGIYIYRSEHALYSTYSIHDI
jgi:hypothetical protein